MKYTKEEIDKVFDRLVSALNKRKGNGVGDWYISYTPGSGYVIVEAREIGMLSYPLGKIKMTPKHIIAALEMALCAVQMNNSSRVKK